MDWTRHPTARRGLFTLLYLGEGAPVGFIWWALPTLFAGDEREIDEITRFTALLVVPWMLKFVWAPLVDVGRGRIAGVRWDRRQWVIATQVAMGLTLLPLAFLDWDAQLGLVFALLLAHTLAAATQDVAIDAWAIEVTPPIERGAINGWMQAGYLTGRWLFGAGLLLALAYTPMQRGAVVVAMVAVIWATAATVLLVTRTPTSTTRLEGGFWRTLASAMRSRQTWLGLALAAVGGAGFEALGAVAGPLLLSEGFDRGAAGWFYTASVPCMVAGALVGGRVADRVGKSRAFGGFLVLLAAMVLAVAASVAWGPRGLVMATMIAVYLGIGLFTATSYALFMDLTDPRLGGTQFSAYMGATNGCEMWAGLLVGALAVRLGYAPALAILAGLSLLALPVAVGLHSTSASTLRASPRRAGT